MSAAPAFASVDDLADFLGEAITDPAAERRAERVLRLTSVLIRTVTGKQWVDDSGALVDPLPEALELVTLQAAARAYENPYGATSKSEGVDDYQTSERFHVKEAGVYLTDSEREMLLPLSGRRFGGLGTISRSRGESAPSGLGLPEDERLLPPYY